MLTKCCHTSGTVCYQKNELWSACGYACKPGYGWSKDWTCKELGKRTPQKCAWSGGACTFSKTCCHPNAKCYSRNPLEAYCSNHPDTEVKPDWDGTVLGGSRQEWEVQPVAPEEARGTSLFCLMATLPNSPEDALIAKARDKQASIFACDAHLHLNSWKSTSAKWDSGFNTLVNTDVFLDVWKHVKADGRYASYDWTVKVDADSVFFPDRLRSHLAALHAPKLMPIYVKNTAADFGFLGAIEVFSKEALDVYFSGDAEGANDEHCLKEITTQAGEDGFMKGCMDILGAGFMTDIDVLRTPAATDCGDANRVCFHAFKDVAAWEGCYNAAIR